ncbi:ATP:guanido phosphotransferase [Globomyces pollinis-pini]|nr:ATP:guanido phosphotransferase [Globomyces pollinis-pini]
MGGGASKGPVSAASNDQNEMMVNKILASHVRNPDNLMAKHFSEAYYNGLPEDKKVRLLKICRSGGDNADSSLGMYAQQPDDYDVFFDYFDKVIREYHKISGPLQHVTNWDLSTRQARLEALGCGDGKLDLTKLGLGKTSMRVRVGRNLSSFPLPGSMTKQDRIQMENKMISAFKNLINDPAFGGQYYSLTPSNPYYINNEKYQQLVKDHIMFKDMAADKYLNSAGISSNWPFGRGCYVSADREFIVWVGEEDHLRIMCMIQGTVLNNVFDRLNTAEKIVEKHADKFARSNSYGYVTSCPTNLGTGMRASLHIQLPFLTSDGTDKNAKAVCKPLGLSVRGLGGEHTPIGADGTVDISPSARLMIEEVDIVCNLYEGIRNLLTAEKSAAEVYEKAQLAKISAAKTSNPDNLMAKHFNKSYYDGLATNSLRAQLLKICKSGTDNSDSHLGMYAMQPNDYEQFSGLFDLVIREYHKIEGEKVHTTNWNLSTKQSRLDELGCPDGKLDLAKLGLGKSSMRVRVGRNLASFPLPGAMTKDDRIKMENVMIGAFKNLISDKAFGGQYYSLTPGNPFKISDEKYQELVKDHIMFKDMSADSYLNSAGISSNWPYGRGCYVSADKEFIVWVGEEDHLRIMCMIQGTILNSVFDRLQSAEKVVEKYADKFARSKKYGYVTSCPTNLGTGMRASIHVKLPALTSDGTDKKAKAVCKPLGLSVRGLGGEHTPIGADGTVDISPSARLMIEEADIVCSLYKGIQLLLQAENEAKSASA